MDPYKRLELPEAADDSQIKIAYLNKVKQFPPEHHPQTFQQVQAAYQLIKDKTARIKYRLLKVPEFDVSQIVQQQLTAKNTGRPSAAQLLNLLENSHSNDK
jgi:DnaJ-class molecular chaperone